MDHHLTQADIKKLTLVLMGGQQKKFIIPIMVIQKIIQIRMSISLDGMKMEIPYLAKNKKGSFYYKL